MNFHVNSITKYFMAFLRKNEASLLVGGVFIVLLGNILGCLLLMSKYL